MRIAIDFDNQPMLVAVKVDNIFAERFLSVELGRFIEGHFAEGVPKMSFGRRRVVSQITGFFVEGGVVGDVRWQVFFSHNEESL